MAKRRRNTPRRDAPAARGLLSEGAAVLVMASALLLLLSLISYRNSDPVPLLGSWHGEDVGNVVGVVGAFCSAALYGTFGWAAWTAPILIFLVGWRLFFRRPSRLLAGGLGSALILVSLTASLDLAFNEAGPVPGHRAGGWIGYLAAQALAGPFNRWGGLIVAVALAITGVVVVGRASVVEAMRSFLTRVGRLLQSAWLAFVRHREARRRDRQREEMARRQRERQERMVRVESEAPVEPRGAAPIPLLSD
ncbi:MAG TPA: DNA translocase FtsK 4TM domain-containing protein, partial [Candidatus Polarisedimenticolia bacterium]|nr:DNA translocase FtsK 4TM domain-containing protein [Candidatus Polarisedimenticolia bacterium]